MCKPLISSSYFLKARRHSAPIAFQQINTFFNSKSAPPQDCYLNVQTFPGCGSRSNTSREIQGTTASLFINRIYISIHKRFKQSQFPCMGGFWGIIKVLADVTILLCFSTWYCAEVIWSLQLCVLNNWTITMFVFFFFFCNDFFCYQLMNRLCFRISLLKEGMTIRQAVKNEDFFLADMLSFFTQQKIQKLY